MLDTLDLRFLLAIREQGTLVGAARALNVTPSAVTQRLQQLENRLGIHLVDRTARRLSFTDEGEFLCGKGKALLEQHKALLEELSGRHGKLSGSLNINAPFGFGRKYLSFLIGEFHRMHPHIKVSLKLSEQPLLEDENRFDLVIHIGEMRNSSLIAHKIAANERFVCAAPDLLKQYGMPASPQDLLALPCLALSENNEDTTLWSFEKNGRKKTIRIRPVLAANDGGVVCLWAKAGIGVIMRSQWDVAEALDRGELVRLLSDWNLPKAPVIALTKRRKGVPERVWAFIALLKKAFAPAPPWRKGKA
jgi:DNA-binding transcriptional LysR family regulator